MNNDIEWKMVKLGDVATFLPTNTLSRDELNYSEGEYLDIHYGDVLIKFDSVTDVLDSDIPFVSGNKKFAKHTFYYLNSTNFFFNFSFLCLQMSADVGGSVNVTFPDFNG